MRQGSSGNVIAALVSFFIPGLGQLIQGRILAAHRDVYHPRCMLFICIPHIWNRLAFLSRGRGYTSPASTPRSGKDDKCERISSNL